MSHKEAVFERLNRLGIPCERHEHHRVHTIAECLALPYAEPDVTFCKNILLCNRQGTEYWLYVTLPDKPFRTADVSRALGVSRLSFAPAEKLPEYGCSAAAGGPEDAEKPEDSGKPGTPGVPCGMIPASRYESYKKLMKELSERRKYG